MAAAQFLGDALVPAHGLASVTFRALGLPARASEAVLEAIARQALLGLVLEGAFQTAFAKVAPAALQKVEAQIRNDLRQARQVLVKKLFLQRDRGRGDDDGLLQQFRRYDGRKAVGHRLARAGAGLQLRQVVAWASLVVGRSGAEESQQRRVHHLVLAGAGDEAGPGASDLAVEELQALASLLEQFGRNALGAGVGGRFHEGIPLLGNHTGALRRGRGHGIDYRHAGD